MPFNLKKIFSDFTMNLMANCIYIITIQLFLYPLIADVLGIDYYGLFLLYMAGINTVGSTLGNSLNNVRLISNKDYNNLSGDFNILLIIIEIITIFLGLGFCFFHKVSPMTSFILIIICIFSILRNYLSVEFRLNMNFSKVVISNIIISVCYVLGGLWYKYYGIQTESWILIFLFSEVIVFIYLYFETSLLKEPFIKTRLFSDTSIKYLNLIYSSFIANLLIYFDRNMLFPLIGGAAVSTYFAATIVGKSVCILTGPMSTVLLSYYAQVDFTMTKKKFWLINKTICLTAVVSYIFILLIVDYIVKFLYPSIYSSAKELFIIANIIPVLEVISNMARPAIVRYVSLTKLSIYYTIMLLINIVISYYSIMYFGIIGFCYSCIFFSVIKLIVMWYMGNKVIPE